MMRSMYSGVSGLRAHQTKMDVIGNNIANVNTMGYKTQRVTFNDVFSQTIQDATGASDETGRGGRNGMQIGLGVNVSSIDMLMTPGAAQRTDNPFDLMINGDGFIVANDGSGQYFTRAGALRLDEQGNLVIPNGMKVQGWPANADGTDIVRGQVQDINLGDPSITNSPPQTTTKTTIGGNLDTNDGNIMVDTDGDGTYDAIDNKAKGIPTQIKMYDSLGNQYSMEVYMVYNPATTEIGGVKPGWNIFNQKSDTTPPAFTNGEVVLKDKDGNQVKAGVNFTGANFTYDATGKEPEVKFPAPPASIGIPPITNLPNGAVLGDATNGIQVDISKLTQYSAKTKVESKPTDGKPAGQMQGYDVGADGKITAYYNNGTTRVLAQIIVAEFENPAGLEKMGDNLFKTTANSGDFDSIGNAGNFQSGVLEMSNVDLSLEFTEMIVTQRGFQANSRIISVSDEMLQEVVNIKR